MMQIVLFSAEENYEERKKGRTVNNRKLWNLLQVFVLCAVCCVLCVVWHLGVCCGIFNNTVMKNAVAGVCCCVCFF